MNNDITDLSKMVVNLSETIKTYIASNDQVIKNLQELSTQHGYEIWGKNGSPGAKIEIHTLKLKEEERSKREDKTSRIQLATITAVIGLGLKGLWDWVIHIRTP